jgi:cell division protein FtsB
MSTAQHGRFEDVGVGVRLKITSLWIAMLFLFAYGDIFGFFAPGRIEEIQGGWISGMEITQTFLLAVSAYIAIASAMVFLTLVLRPAANRWVNIVVAALYIVSIVASMFGEDAYFVFLSLAEIAMLGLIVWYAWTWPERSPADGS